MSPYILVYGFLSRLRSQHRFARRKLKAQGKNEILTACLLFSITFILVSCSALPARLPLSFSVPTNPQTQTPDPTKDSMPVTGESTQSPTRAEETHLQDPVQLSTSTPTTSLKQVRPITEPPPATAQATPTLTPSETPRLISYFLFVADGKLKLWDHFTKRIETLAQDVIEYSVNQSGQRIVLLENKAIAANGVALYRVALLDLETGQTSTIIPETARVYGLTISPDGRWIAYTSQENGGSIYAQPVDGDVKANKIGECVVEHELRCISKITWAPDGSSLLWSDERGIWLSDLKETSPQLVLADKLPIQDPQGETNDVQMTYQQISWSPSGRYALAVVSPVASEVRWQGIVDISTNRLAQIPNTYEYKEQSTSAAWMPDGELIVAHRSDAQTGRAPFLELWSVLPTRDELLKLEGTYELPVNDITINPLYAEAKINYYPKFLSAISDRQIAIALFPQDDQFPPTLFIYNLKYSLLEKLNEIIYDSDNVLVSPDFSGAMITGWHGEILFAPNDNAPIVDMRAIFGGKISNPAWLPLVSLHP